MNSVHMKLIKGVRKGNMHEYFIMQEEAAQCVVRNLIVSTFLLDVFPINVFFWSSFNNFKVLVFLGRLISGYNLHSLNL